MSPEEKVQVIEAAMEEIMSQPKKGAWLVLRDIADAYRAESESMTVDTDPSADDHRDLIGFLRENATELGIDTRSQGEPSDAQVLAALNAYYADYMIRPNKSLDDVRPPRTVQDMRAALRAAGGVR